MSVSRFLKKFGKSGLASPTSTSASSSRSMDDPDKPSHHRLVSEQMKNKRLSGSDHPGVSQLPLTPAVEGPTSSHGVRELSSQMSFSTTFAMETPPEHIPAINSVPEKLVAAWHAVKDDRTNTTLRLDNVGEAAAAVQNIAEPFKPIINATFAATQPSGMKEINEGIDNFSESMPIFMKALDELKSLHPIIGVIVLAFQTVYTLEQKRRDNDKKITSLFVGMRDMMGVLFLLKGMDNDKMAAPDGISIEDRLKSLVDCTADDIKMCSNVCDAYMKKTLLAKVLMSAVWDAKLLDFVKLFATRRQEFEFELTMHTGQGVDKANAKLDAIGEATRALNEQMNVIEAMFQNMVSPEQRWLSELVAVKGGVKALKEDDKVLRELEKVVGKETGAPITKLGRTRREPSKDTNLSVTSLRRDIFEDPNVAVEKNLAVFSRKFQAQKNQITDKLTLVVKRESDRVIQEVKGGPHERILDRAIHEIWTEMGWRGSVKARHFVLALRDHYLEKPTSGIDNVLGMSTAGVNCALDPDAWAIKYIDIARLQPILEAIDDDASGFITIGEMNRFTASRPIDWSLPHWVAFWARGYWASIIDYSHKISELFAKMDGIRVEVLPLNRHPIISYFGYNWTFVCTLIAPFLPLQPAREERERFKSYLEAEEARLENNLRAVDYIVDGMDTLTLITGVGRIEKTVFPLLYLLMKHHYEIMRIMRTKVLDSREIYDGINSMLYVKDAIAYRVDDLMNNFSQQKLDIKRQFQNFAGGMFEYFHDPSSLWSRDLILGLDPQTTPYDDANEDQSVKVEDLLRFKSLEEPSLDYWVYDGHSIHDVPSYGAFKPPLKDILGHWHGYFYENGGVRGTQGTDSMMTLVLEPADGERDFKVNGWSIRGRFTFTGSWSIGENDVMQIKFKMSYRIEFSIPIFFNGHFDPKRDALTGVWGYSNELENSMGLLEFRRIQPRYLTVYPSIKEFSDNKSRAFWKFAIAARRDDRETVVSSTVRYLFFGKPLDKEEIKKLRAAVHQLTPADACFYGSIINRKRAHVLTHGGIYCDSCRGFIGGARLTCLDCHNKDGNAFDTLDLCCSPESRCIDARITHRGDLAGPHEPFHKLIKMRTAVPIHHFGRTYKLARAAFERAEEFLTKIAGASQQPQDEKETGWYLQNALTQDPATIKQPSGSDQPDDVLAEADDSQGSRIEVGPTTTEMLSKGDNTDDVTTMVDRIKGGLEPETTVTGAPNTSETAKGDASEELITDDKVSQARLERQDRGLPTCGGCNDTLSFPLWYCIICEDDLFICDTCDAKGVPDLARSSGKHTEEHHLIRCLEPTGKDDGTVSSPDQRLISMEGRLADMQTEFRDLSARIGNIEVLLHKLAGTDKSE
ncbi:hypothetical protein BC827DRAFT_1273837 [Russula dissimulans]|nr:hypothetical protein BC827DRAFT_1273837 [Russula dissimulans]